MVFDISDRTQIELTGADRSKFLQGFCTNDIARLKIGQGCEAFLTNIKGRVVGHIFVFATENSLWIDTVNGQGDAIISHLNRYLIREDVQFCNHSELGELFVTGLHASALLMLDEGLPPLGHLMRESLGQPFHIRRVDLTGSPGFQISLPRENLATVKSSLLAVGCTSGSSDLFESLRIAAGFPQFGVDISDDNIAQEVARTKECISFTKGCYLGQEPIARLDALGHTNRELRRLRFAPGLKPAPGTTLLAAEGDHEAGTLTSVAPLPTATGETLAHGYLKTKFGKPQTPVRAMCGDRTITAVVQ